MFNLRAILAVLAALSMVAYAAPGGKVEAKITGKLMKDLAPCFNNKDALKYQVCVAQTVNHDAWVYLSQVFILIVTYIIS